MGFRDFFNEKQWKVVDVQATQPRAAELLPTDDLPLAPESQAYLRTLYPQGVYRHQKIALQKSLAGENVCLVTGTASGKSLVFQTVALDLFARDPNARVMAIYPMKALGNEQRERWQRAFVGAGMAGENAPELENLVGRIDGNVPPGFRLGILERSRVVVFTPDIIHAWLFSNLNQPAVISFLRNVRLIVVDEVHAYSGVFGSNSAMLFRRLQHLLGLLNAHPQFICASATIARPAQHLASLIGQEFSLIGPEDDSSPRFPLDVYLVEPPGTERFLDDVVHLLEYLTKETSSRFIAFVDSRKQVELISSILNRLLREAAKEAAEKEAAARLAEAKIAEAKNAAAKVASVTGEADGDEAFVEDEEEILPRRPAKPARGRGGWGKSTKKADDEPGGSLYDEPDAEGEISGVLQQLNVLPYRAGYEDHDRRQIQDRLAEGTLNGVVSTSALELGIDIPHLDICVLIGVPGSSTSLQQRIGRIGRHGPGAVLVVNGGDIHDQAVFAHPQSFFQRPLAESTLYLENEHIQYIHALCLARAGGEHDQVLEAASKTDARAAVAFARRAKVSFSSPVEWPENFIHLCQQERSGDIPRHLTSLRLEAHERPNYTFPLRDVESQFKVERRDGPNVSAMGSLSFGQLMREAYPGAIYYYATVPYRVTRVNVKSKVVTVRREKRYTTQPQRTPPAVFPRLSPGGVFAASQQGPLVSLEASLLVRESIRGVVEQRGRNESIYPYPLSREMGFSQDQPYFSRNFFTTGVVLTHPALECEGVALEAVAAIAYEAFMLMIPFDRQDIGFAADRMRVDREPLIRQGQPFLTIFDQTYGSLRLSTRLLDPAVLGKVMVEALMLGKRQDTLASGRASLGAIAEIARTAFRAPRELLAFGSESKREQRDPAEWERIVMPGSKGLMVRTNEEFHVLRILNTPVGLSYEGTPASMLGTGASVMPLLADVAEIPGESTAGWYNLGTGAVEPAEADLSAIQVNGEPTPPPPVDADWLRRVLSVYFEAPAVLQLAQRMGSPATEAAAAIDALVGSADLTQVLETALDVALEAIPDETQAQS